MLLQFTFITRIFFVVASIVFTQVKIEISVSNCPTIITESRLRQHVWVN